jgi:hypothetical protein
MMRNFKQFFYARGGRCSFYTACALAVFLFVQFMLQCMSLLMESGHSLA